MCSRPVKIPKLDSDVLDQMPSLEEKGPAIEFDPFPVPTSSKSPGSPAHSSQVSNPESSSDITLVLEIPGISSQINNTIKLQTIIDSLDEAMEDELDRVQKRFYRQKRPYFDERRLVLEQIPFFWRTTLLRHPELYSIMEELDVQILDHLYSIDILEYSDGDCAYKISFFFKENPFFSNEEFTKEVRMIDSEELVSIGTKIKWKKPYISLNRRLKPGDKRSPDDPRCEFFHWFSSSNSKYLDRIGEILRDDIWPNPIKYFLPHSGSTEELVVLTDSDSDSDTDQIPLEDMNRVNSDVISIDDDDDEDCDVISPTQDLITSSLINGDVSSSPPHNSVTLNNSAQTVYSPISHDFIDRTSLTPTLPPVSELRESTDTNAHVNSPPTSTDQTNLVLEVQQESEA
ncbi:hypothetical protein LOD99_1981 [Oopsacas minuta]|uniref:TSPY n=1 Tax=Oopsacas minuta TaxID=111878 RepID=A0AAV7K2S3_9METZ|nr:hypothetical protein LOD99_1981 [Oopsacas minuta]